jgi:hypothetical protein
VLVHAPDANTRAPRGEGTAAHGAPERLAMTAGVEPEDPTAIQVGEPEPPVHPTAERAGLDGSWPSYFDSLPDISSSATS